eukprot:g1491.t1
MPVSQQSCLTPDCFARCDGAVVPGGAAACRVTDWYRNNVLAKSAQTGEREGAYPHIFGSRVLGYDRNVRTGSSPQFNQIQGCNLLRAQECITYMKDHPPDLCDLKTVVAGPQPGCCAAYEPTARCVRDVGCGNHFLIEDLFNQCRHHGCVLGCEFSAAIGLRPSLVALLVASVLCGLHVI